MLMKAIVKILIIIGSIFLLSGCQLYKVKVNSIGEIDRGKLTYVLLSSNENVSMHDLQFKEYAKYVERVLSEKGYVRVEKNSNVVIFLSYGVGEPIAHNYNVLMPVVTYSESNTKGTYKSGNNSYGSNNNKIYQDTKTKYKSTSNEYVQKTKIIYNRYIELEAVDVEEYIKNNDVVQLWNTTINSTGSNGDLREAFPVMLVAGSEYIGTNTGKDVKVTISSSDSRIKVVQGLK